MQARILALFLRRMTFIYHAKPQIDYIVLHSPLFDSEFGVVCAQRISGIRAIDAAATSRIVCNVLMPQKSGHAR